jgi:uncharacterized protein YggE
MRFSHFSPVAISLLLVACGEAPYDPRGVDREETLLSVSATGEAQTRPDNARFEAGVNNWAQSARSASEANAADIRKIVAALRAAGVAEKDIQTRIIGVQRLDYGDRKGQFQASNIVSVTVSDIDRTGAAVAAVTDAGANIVSGPDLRMSDPESAANSAYGSAYRAARSRAEAYAEAAGMEISRVLSIRDAGGAQGNRYLPGALPVAPPPVAVSAQAGGWPAPEEGRGAGGGMIMTGETTSSVAVQVDFALKPK